MKNLIYSLLAICLVHTFSFAQQPNMGDSILYLTPQEEAFMIDKESKYLFKIQPYSNLAYLHRARAATFAFEQKLGKAFSISPIVALDINNNYETLPSRINLGIEFRYYYKLPKLIKEQKQANNLSSNYFASSIGADYSIEDDWIKNSNKFELSYGIQRRFLNYGYLDFRINLGVNRLNLNRSKIGDFKSDGVNEFYISTGTNVGIGLGKRYELSEEAKCPIFRCFSNRRTAFKINLNKIWSLSYFKFGESGHTQLLLDPNIIYEVKIGKLPISFEQDLNTTILFTNRQGLSSDGVPQDNSYFGFYNLWLTYNAGFKYYYNLKSRIRNGKSGNNLSGLYIFGRGQYALYWNPSSLEHIGNGTFKPKKITEHRKAAQLGYGYQKEVLENLFFDINLGLSKGIGKENDSFNKVGIFSRIKVGIML